jgi:ribonuclease P protein 3
VLYAWFEQANKEDALRLIRILLGEAKSSLSSQEYRKSVDEKVGTVIMRFLPFMDAEEASTTLRMLLSDIGADQLRRRMLLPVFQACCDQGNVGLMKETFLYGLGGGLEYWDADFAVMFKCIERAAQMLPLSMSDPLLGATDAVMELGLVPHQPVVGRNSAESLRALLGGEFVSIRDDGVCSRCGHSLESFEWCDEERSSLIHDIVEKLVRPRIEGPSSYEPMAVVTEELRQQRWASFEKFRRSLEEMNFDTVIDGANVGYYGLSSWYKDAKAALLAARGVDISRVPWGELNTIPFPVDVPPQFPAIDVMVSQIQRLGLRPLVVLHERHTRQGLSATIDHIVQRWRAQQCLLESPVFLNDDYCWLLAAVLHPGCNVVSNDLMRDHHLKLLSQRSFLRWRQRHRITYKSFVGPHSAIGIKVQLPAPFGVWAQSFMRGAVKLWHVPVLLSSPILDQSTNKLRATQPPESLEKDGDDTFEAWLCTATDQVR